MATDISYIVAFGGGVISFASPCVLPLVPAYLSVISGVDIRSVAEERQSQNIKVRQSVNASGSQVVLADDQDKNGKVQKATASAEHSLALGQGLESTAEVSKANQGSPYLQVAKATSLFIVGFTVVFVVLGMTATALGRSIFQNHILISRIGGVLVSAMGLFIIAGSITSSSIFAREFRFHANFKRLGTFGPLLAGGAFGFGWTPCIGPILSSILSIAASQGSIGKGASLLGVYSLGLGVPFMAMGLGFSKLKTSFDFIKRHVRGLSVASGTFLLVFGLLLAFDRFSIVTVYLNSFFTSIGLSKLIYLG
ncbi:MAG: cytochrome c biogenesis CcdA family protein [Actinomycetota bacterium]|nr:cytochrome c biogenesis CcdA family protein [Actinomycetota bacterium]